MIVWWRERYVITFQSTFYYLMCVSFKSITSRLGSDTSRRVEIALPGHSLSLADGIKKKGWAGIVKIHCELQAAIVYAALYSFSQFPTSSFLETIHLAFTQSFSPCSFAAKGRATITEGIVLIKLWCTRRCEYLCNIVQWILILWSAIGYVRNSPIAAEVANSSDKTCVMFWILLDYKQHAKIPSVPL